MPAQMKKAAVHVVLSKKLAEGEIKIVDALTIASAKTKLLDGALKKFLKASARAKNLSALIIPAEKGSIIYRAAANIPTVRATGPSSLGIEEVLRYRHLVIERDAVSLIR